MNMAGITFKREDDCDHSEIRVIFTFVFITKLGSYIKSLETPESGCKKH